MRKFTKTEKELLKLFVKEQCENKIQNLQVAKILRETIPFFAISWETEPKGKLTIHVKKTDKPTDWDSVQNTFMSITDFMYFLKELEGYQFIKFVTMSNLDNDNNDRKIFNRKELAYNEEFQSFVMPIEVKVKDYSGFGIIESNRSDYFLDVANELDALSNKIIYPLPALREYVRNRFMTQEDIYQRRAMHISIAAFLVAMISTVISIFK